MINRWTTERFPTVVAPLAVVHRVLLEGEFLQVCVGLGQETDHEEPSAGAVQRRHGLRRGWYLVTRGINDYHRQTDDVHPHSLRNTIEDTFSPRYRSRRETISTEQIIARIAMNDTDRARFCRSSHLERPKHGEADDVAAAIVESLVAADLDDSVQEVSGQPYAPYAHERGHHDLSAVVRLSGEKKKTREVSVLDKFANHRLIKQDTAMNATDDRHCDITGH